MEKIKQKRRIRHINRKNETKTEESGISMGKNKTKKENQAYQQEK